MVYTGQMTHPGPGLPPSMISGILAAKQLNIQLNDTNNYKIPLFYMNLFLIGFLRYLWKKNIRVRSYYECCKLLYIQNVVFI